MTRKAWYPLLATAAAVALLGATSAAATRTSTSTIGHPTIHNVTSYQIDSSHDGISTDVVGTHWRVAWATHLSGTVTYPIIANDRVIVGVDARTPFVEAFAAASGRRAWGPVSFSGATGDVGLALDGPTLFALGPIAHGELLMALNEISGRVEWVERLGADGRSYSAPVAYGGYVFVATGTTGATVMAISERTHHVAWSVRVASGPGGVLAANAVGAFYSFSCATDGALTRAGRYLWRTVPGCTGSGGTTPVLSGGSAFIRQPPNTVWQLARSSGSFDGNFSSAYAPLVVGNVMYTVETNQLDALNVKTNAAVFSFAPAGACLAGPALDVHGTIYVLTACPSGGSKNARLYGVSTTGAQVSETAIPLPQRSAPAPTIAQEAGALQGMAEGNGVFVIPGGDRLVVLLP